VLNFYLPGQIIGMESIYPGIYQCDVVALDTASVCEFSYPELNRLASDHPELQERVLRLLSQDLHHAYLMLTNERTAEERLAAFLLEMANRQQDHGWSAHSLVLPMSRRDLASYLGLATETVSRLFSRLQADGLITAARRQIILHDLNRLGERARISDYKFCQ
jgi:CRP/FNR family transcriptional regulator